LTEKSHGRIETREIQVLAVSAERLGFPFCAQLALLHRTRLYLKSGKSEEGWLYLLCSRDPKACSPANLLTFSRGHWTIEVRVHYCRDFTYDEDRCRIRQTTAARVCATLRSLAIYLLGRDCSSRRDTRPRRQKRINRHPGIAVKMVTTIP
jgi:hypothetical protein